MFDDNSRNPTGLNSEENNGIERRGWRENSDDLLDKELGDIEKEKG